jgi:O-antigen/teichoic acid export membrane protein
MKSLRQKMLSGLFWSAIERFGQQGIQFIITIIIARILTPADYGLIGMITIFIGVSVSFIDSGFGQALIQRQNATKKDESTVFFFNIVLGCVFFLILFLIAPLIAAFYKQPILTPITRVMALSLIINSFGLVQNTLITKTIDFKRLTKISVISVIISGAVGIILALRGFGVWSLVIQVIIGNLIRNILLWLLSKWRPLFAFSIDSFKSLFSFGSKLLASGLLNQIFDNIYNLVIGKIYTPASLGFYTQAKRMQEIPVTNSLAILQRVTFPVYSTIQNDTERLKSAYRKTIKAIVLINFPLMIGLMVCAEPFVKVFLTDKWLPAVPFLQLLCIIGLFLPLSSVNLNILQVKGRTDIFFYLEIAKKIIIALAILITFRYGIYIMIFGQVCTSFVAHFLNIFYSGRLIKYSIREQINDVAIYLFLASGVGTIVYLGGIFLNSLPVVFILIMQVVAFTVLYLILTHLFKLEAYKDFRSILDEKFFNIHENQIGVIV